MSHKQKQIIYITRNMTQTRAAAHSLVIIGDQTALTEEQRWINQYEILVVWLCFLQEIFYSNPRTKDLQWLRCISFFNAVPQQQQSTLILTTVTFITQVSLLQPIWNAISIRIIILQLSFFYMTFLFQWVCKNYVNKMRHVLVRTGFDPLPPRIPIYKSVVSLLCQIIFYI